MKKQLFQKIEIPEGVEVSLNEGEIVVKGAEGENKRKFKFGKLRVEKKDNEIIISHDRATKKEKKMINTIAAHIRNMIAGVQKKFVYELKICSSHFPMSVSAEGRKAVVKNFLGEKVPREVAIPDGADVGIKGQMITISSADKETAGQAAANFERATRIRNKDRRVFQDGIFITNKCGREI